MRDYVIGILSMIGGFLSLAIENYPGAYCCFGFAFILWCVFAVYEYKRIKENKEE